MKRKFSVLLLAVAMCILCVSVCFASEEYQIEYFLVILKAEYSENPEQTVEGFNCDGIEAIEIISEPEGSADEDYQAILVVYIKTDNKENVSRVYSYFSCDEKVYSISPDYEMIQEKTEEEKKLQTNSYLMPYDVNGDGAVTAKDARDVLRASVGLYELNLPAKRAAGVDENEKISAFDARKILRASVGLEKAPGFTVELENFGEEFVIGPLDCHGSAGFFWECSGDIDKFTVTEKSYGAETLDIGGAVRYYYIFTPKEKGFFALKFTYNDIKVHETVNEFTVNVHHMVKVCVLPGPEDEIWKKNSDS